VGVADAVGHQLAHEKLGILPDIGVEKRLQRGDGMARGNRRSRGRWHPQEDEDMHGAAPEPKE
jgi:hypothetical protein